ncbi:hypothetical protein [Vibrio sp. VB16]|uniref:hypothetical protein n=1 Tax=Vibrio sp. VB16 TaxID=2785746 RepID=UPI00189DDFAE|nr:hypothetical protein [Vibrio sp. VB16]UGA57606.1 hypothetical protein IUZ65_019140 [Vibrio sp. VB16]
MIAIKKRTICLSVALLVWSALLLFISLSFLNALGCKYKFTSKNSNGTNIYITCNNAKVTVVTEDIEGSVWQSEGFQFSLFNQLVYIYTSSEKIFDSHTGNTKFDTTHVLFDDGLPKHFWIYRWNADSLVMLREHPISMALKVDVVGFTDFSDRWFSNMNTSN